MKSRLWLPWCVVLAGIAGTIGRLPWMPMTILRVAAALAATILLVSPAIQAEASWLAPIFALVLVAEWELIDAIGRQEPGGALPVSLAIVFGAAAVVIIHAHTGSTPMRPSSLRAPSRHRAHGRSSPRRCERAGADRGRRVAGVDACRAQSDGELDPGRRIRGHRVGSAWTAAGGDDGKMRQCPETDAVSGDRRGPRGGRSNRRHAGDDVRVIADGVIVTRLLLSVGHASN